MKHTLLQIQLRKRTRRALTQTEMVVSLAVISMLCAVMVVGVMFLQRNFKASGNYVAKESAQMRLLDYLALDLRRALTVNANNTNGSIQLTMPDFYQTDGTPRTPQIKAGLAYYGNPANPKRVSYFRRNNDLVRQEGTTETKVASDVQDFNVSFRDEGQVIEVRVSFIPTFSRAGGSREGTTTICRTLLRNKRQS
jgi:hypothetical protein